MLKKAVLGGLCAAVVLGLIIGTGAISYVKTSVRMAQNQVADNIPIDFQIERARGMVNDLEGVIETNTKAIALEEVELQRLDERIGKLEDKLAADQNNLLLLREAVEKNDQVMEYRGEFIPVSQVKESMVNQFDRFQVNQSTLGNLKEVRQARHSKLMAARDKFDTLIAEKRQLEVEIENLEARVQMVEAAKATSDVHFDDGHLGRVQKLVDSLQTRIEVDERLVQTDMSYPTEIRLDEQNSSDDIADRVAEYFGVDKPGVKNVAAE